MAVCIGPILCRNYVYLTTIYRFNMFNFSGREAWGLKQSKNGGKKKKKKGIRIFFWEILRVVLHISLRYGIDLLYRPSIYDPSDIIHHVSIFP